jgi:hypothetical protein
MVNKIVEKFSEKNQELLNEWMLMDSHTSMLGFSFLPSGEYCWMLLLPQWKCSKQLPCVIPSARHWPLPWPALPPSRWYLKADIASVLCP